MDAQPSAGVDGSTDPPLRLPEGGPLSHSELLMRYRHHVTGRTFVSLEETCPEPVVVHRSHLLPVVDAPTVRKSPATGPPELCPGMPVPQPDCGLDLFVLRLPGRRSRDRLPRTFLINTEGTGTLAFAQPCRMCPLKVGRKRAHGGREAHPRPPSPPPSSDPGPSDRLLIVLPGDGGRRRVILLAPSEGASSPPGGRDPAAHDTGADPPGGVAQPVTTAPCGDGVAPATDTGSPPSPPLTDRDVRGTTTPAARTRPPVDPPRPRRAPQRRHRKCPFIEDAAVETHTGEGSDGDDDRLFRTRESDPDESDDGLIAEEMADFIVPAHGSSVRSHGGRHHAHWAAVATDDESLEEEDEEEEEEEQQGPVDPAERDETPAPPASLAPTAEPTPLPATLPSVRRRLLFDPEE